MVILLDSLALIDSAKSKIKELKRIIPDLSLGIGYRYIAHPGNQIDGQQIVILEFLSPIRSVAVLIGEAVGHLRSALDMAVVQLSLRNPECPNTRGLYFPISERKESFHGNDGQKKIKYLSNDAKEVINKSEPYKDGNNFLYEFNELRKLGTHLQLVSTIGSPTNLVRAAPSGNLLEDMLTGAFLSYLSVAYINAGGYGNSLEIDVSEITTNTADIIETLGKYALLPTSLCFATGMPYQGQFVNKTLNDLTKITAEIIESLEATV